MGTGAQDAPPDLTRREIARPMAANPRVAVSVRAAIAGGPS